MSWERHSRGYGARSPHETSTRALPPPDSTTPATGASRTPLQDTYGIITPSSLHFERLHAGVPDIDPATHELLMHGLVDQPLVYTIDDLQALSVRFALHFVECSGNGRSEYSADLATNASGSATVWRVAANGQAYR